MEPDQNIPIYHEDYTAIHLPATFQYYATPSTNQDLLVTPFGQDALTLRGITQMYDPQGRLSRNYEFTGAMPIPSMASLGSWPPLTPAEIGYNGPLHSTTEHGISRETLAPGQRLFPLDEDGQQNNLHENRLLDIDLLGLELETTPAVQIPYPQLQCRFLQFLMNNLPLLNAVTNSAPDAMATIQLAFEEDIQRSGLSPHLADIQKIFLQFKPIIGSFAIRKESDSRKTNAAKRQCPFQFCSGHFTRAVGLQNHLSAHFSLAPNQCPHCGKCYSNVSFRRHVDNCRKVVSKV